jgi:hypothetical protein
MEERMPCKLAVCLLLLACFTPCLCEAQTIAPLAHPLFFQGSVSALLTDGTVLVHAESEAGPVGSRWYRLTPDRWGSYVNGSWTVAAQLPVQYSPLGESIAVLADGRLVSIGGEYDYGQFDLSNKSAIYDPVANKWTALDPPRGWHYIGDSPLVVLPDGRLLVGNKLNRKMATLDPATLKWKEVSSVGKSDFNSEEGWTLLPDGNVLTEDVKNSPNTEIYSPSSGTWQTAGTTPVDLTSPGSHKIDYGGKHPYHPPGEIGPALLMPDGSVFVAGAIPAPDSLAHSAIFANGQWSAGPDFMHGDSPADSYAALLPNGRVLVETVTPQFRPHLYEYDGSRLHLLPLDFPDLRYDDMIVLPTGEVLMGASGVYRPKGMFNPAWAPAISAYPAQVTRGETYQLFGTQFNGLSQAHGFGDELQTATNYPLVRITNKSSGHVIYARTHDHSTMAVATGNTPVWTYFDVPAGTDTGPSTLVVIANGIPSTQVDILVQ